MPLSAVWCRPSKTLVKMLLIGKASCSGRVFYLLLDLLLLFLRLNEQRNIYILGSKGKKEEEENKYTFYRIDWIRSWQTHIFFPLLANPHVRVLVFSFLKYKLEMILKFFQAL